MSDKKVQQLFSKKDRELPMWRAYQSFWRNWLNTDGRATVSEVWWVILFQTLAVLTELLVIGFIIPSLVFMFKSNVIGDAFRIFGAVEIPLFMLYLLACLEPTVTLMVRRLHDLNHSGWWLLLFLLFVPFLLVVTLYPSNDYQNRYSGSKSKSKS